VVAADRDGESRPRRVRRERYVGVGIGDGGEGGLWATPAVGQAEVPVVDLEAAAGPLVRPREDERAGATARKRRPHLPVERRRLRIEPVPTAVEAELGEDERPITGDRLQPREVGGEALRRFEIDV